jgi:glucose-6-phosphate isomerase
MNEDTLEYLKHQINCSEIFRVLSEERGYIRQIAKAFDGCDKVLVIGTGGSSLGAKALVNFQACYNGEEPRVIFLENTDSRNFMNIVKKCNPETTGLIVISKSGRTTETLILFLTLCELWPDFDYPKRAIAITEISDNNDLRIIAESKQMRVLPHNPKIGGRFSVFSIVGLLPAYLGGVDIDAFIRGAETVMESVNGLRTVKESKLLVDAITMYNLFKEGTVDQHVLMLYSDMLYDYGRWFTQLVAESLGKSEKFGITPVLAVGTVDQHSLLQLFLGGPKNKLYTVVIQKNNRETPPVDNGTDSGIINVLRGRTIHELMLAHQETTIEELCKRSLVRVTEFDSFSIGTLGTMMMASTLEVLALAHLTSLNPFDQPAVEFVKTGLMQKLAGSGYEPIRKICGR